MRLFKWLRWLTLLLILMGVVVLFLRNPQLVAGWLRQLWEAIVELCRNGFGLSGRRSQADPIEPETSRPQRPFAAFADPFRQGGAPKMRAEALVQYSFAALEAWAREQGIPRAPQQTCVEFCRSVARRFPELATEARQLGYDYAHIAYGHRGSMAAFHPQKRALRNLWRKMRAMHAPSPTAQA